MEASFICGSSYLALKSSNITSQCVLYFYGTAYTKSKTENFDYVVWYVLPIALTLGTFYYMVKEMVVNIHRFLNREKEKVTIKLHEHRLQTQEHLQNIHRNT